MNSIVRDLKNIIDGEVSSKKKDLLAVSEDFGGIVQKKPQVVVRPQNSADIAASVKYAQKQGLTISSKASGHSLSGQSLNNDGILLDMRGLNQIHEFHPDRLWFKGDTGVTWQQVVDRSLPNGVTPPVLTNYFGVTIGGTHSAGGLGPSSFRHGTQADNCLGLEVVTANGDIVWCDSEENSELFNHVLCGYGQFGIITQVKHRLRKYQPFTRTYFLCYDDLNLLLKDEHFLASENLVDALMCLFSPCIMGVSRTANNGLKPLIKWFYRMQVTREFSSEEEMNDDKLLSQLNFYRHIYTENLTFEKFIQPTMTMTFPESHAHPWLDVILPGSMAKEYIDSALEITPSFIDFRNTPIGSFSMLKKNSKMPMFSLPEEDFLVGFGMYPSVPKSNVQPVLEKMNYLTELGFQMGGKRYIASWSDLDLPKWRLQFGDYWLKLNEMKRKYDPKGILNPGFFQYENEEVTYPKLEALT